MAFETEATGNYKGIDLWGFDTAWLWDLNVIRGVNYTKKERTDVIRFSFTGDTPLADTNGDGIGDELTGAGLEEFNTRMALVDEWTDNHTTLYLNNDTDDWSTNPYLVTPNANGVDAVKWAELINVTAEKIVAAGREVVSVAPFNEPDHGVWHGDVNRFGDIAWQLRYAEIAPGVKKFPAFDYDSTDFIRLMGGNTLNNSAGAALDNWYIPLNNWGLIEEGNTHQLAGNMADFIYFHQYVQEQGDLGTNDELHNVMEAMVGAEYGMDVGIWWYTAERARAEFVKASDGMRLGYAENLSNWTAASVYRAPNGQVQAFVGESERQAIPTTFRLLSKDRPVFYDGHGPQHHFDVKTTGDSANNAYQTSNHHNAERIVNVTWGEDVQPAIEGRYYLVNRASLQVMEIDSEASNIGQNTFINDNMNQQWDIIPKSNDSGGDYSYFSVTDAENGMAPYVDWGNMRDGDDIVPTTGVLDAKAQWFLEYEDDGWFKIGSRWSALYLTANGSNVEQQADYDLPEQQWRLVPVDANPTDFLPPAKPKVLRAEENAVSVTLNWRENGEEDLSGYNVLRSNVYGDAYELIARGLKNTSYTDNTANEAMTYYYVIEAVDKSLNRSSKSRVIRATPTAEPGLVAHYAFQLNAMDESINGNDGELNGKSLYVPWGIDGSSVDLNGGHISLPAEIMNYDQITIASWVYWDGGEVWQRIFDFGNGTDEFLYLTPSNGGVMRFAMRHNGVDENLDTSPLPIGQWSHVAVVLGDSTANLYVDGILAASMSTTIKPSDINPLLNYIGKSQFPDARLNGQIDDFRIYNYALSEVKVANLATASTTAPTIIPGRAIALNNADFEAGVISAPAFNGFDSPNDVPGWTDDGTLVDSGVEPGTAWWGTYNGSHSAFVKAGEGAYLMSAHTIQAGDVFDINFVAKSWAGASQWTATLFYDEPANIISSFSTDVTGSWTVYDSPPISSTNDSVGGQLGVLFKNTGGNFANIDEVSLSVSAGSKPFLVTADPQVLTPAFHQMRDIEVKVSFFEEGVTPENFDELSCSVASNEQDNGLQDGNTTGDVNGFDGYSGPVPIALEYDGSVFVSNIKLRAEQSRTGSGRVYSIACIATTLSGNTTTGNFEVIVPVEPNSLSRNLAQ